MDSVGLLKVISGGQTGADMAGLRAAKRAGLETGGTAPFRVDGYGLTVLTIPQNIKARYIKRSQLNVDAADATVAFRTKASAGTDKTIGYCIIGKWSDAPPVGWFPFWEPAFVHKPVLVIIEMNQMSKGALLTFLKEHCVHTLNVAGHRDDGNGWEAAVETFLVDVFNSIK